ncbi:MAG: type III PLP-dependent enzyme [Candidatus Eisenbacteria bacterium]
MRENVEVLRSGLPGIKIYYAMKSNPSPEILGLLNGLVDGIDVASSGEVSIAQQAGFSVDSMIHSHPVKRETDIQESVRLGISQFVFDNADEIPKLAQHAPGCDLLLRVAIKNGSCVVDLSSKFGASRDDVISLLLQAYRSGLNVRGIAFHVGSQSRNPQVYARALKLVGGIFEKAWELGLQLDTLDIGGGFPVSYRESMPSVTEFCKVVSAGCRNLQKAGVTVLCEPGRSISGDSATLITRVTGRARRGGIPWFYIDDGVYGAFSGRLFDHCDYRLISDRRGRKAKCVVAGPTCDSIDVVSRDQVLPGLDIGDLLLVPGMGAYTNASATSFNGFAPPPLIVLDDHMMGIRNTRIDVARRVAVG